MAGKTQHSRLSLKISRVVVFVALLFAASGLGWAGQGRCVTADIPGEFVLPNGSVHEAGALKLCLERTHSPVAAHHRLYVEGHAVQMVQSRIGRSESPSGDEQFALFYRNALNQLELIGYARRDGGDSEEHILVDRDRPVVTTSDVLNDRIGKKEKKEFVLVAVR